MTSPLFHTGVPTETENAMTTEEARAEAERRWPSPNSGLYEGLMEGFVLGAQWAAASHNSNRKHQLPPYGYVFGNDAEHEHEFFDQCACGLDARTHYTR